MNTPDYLLDASRRYKLDRAVAETLAKRPIPDPVEWIESNFYIPETGKPIQLQPYQSATIREALRRDANGLFVYGFILWGDIKKSAKSTIAGAVCLYLAWHYAWETARIVANDLKQADSRTFFYMERAIRLNPMLMAQCAMRKYHISLPNNTSLDAIPVDPKGEAGGGDLITCFTELWAYKNEAAKRLWTETTLSPLKFGKSLRWGETYAGIDGESPILEQAYQTGVKEGRIVDVGIPGLELYANDSARMLTLWNTQPRCPWQTEAYYAQESAVLTDSEFNRVHGNQWATSSEAFVPPEWWDACKTDVSPLQDGEPIVIAVDAGVTSDCFAVVAVSVINDRPVIRAARVWIPPKGGKLAYSNPKNPHDMDYPGGVIRHMANTYTVYEIAYDEYQLHHLMMSIASEEYVNVRAFPQGADRAVSDKRLYDLIKNRGIDHGGIPVLDQHVKNANRKPEDEKYLRIVKRKPELKIDACVAASMAVHRAFAFAW